MPYVYILQSTKNNKCYIGHTADLDRRFRDHQSGKVSSTKGIRPLKLVFKQEYLTISEARKVENRLKALKRKDYLAKIVADGIIKMRP